ncbi:hypothetical protein NST18_11785 [Anoxybacillus sp. FSL W8-0104]|uniref:hypothetical protein n=1 Tax=unclassified Anoxybacillus TaxID=2639704 RepID=UPI0030FA63E8
MKERDNYEWDIDRMINEGMAGGYVYSCHRATNIEEARDVQTEQPPYPSSLVLRVVVSIRNVCDH